MSPSHKRLLFLANNKYASATIRGQQIAKQLGAHFEEADDENISGIVFVKIFPTNIEDLLAKFDNIYFDMVDTDSAYADVARYPSTKLIVFSELARDYASARIENQTIVIPEHHCNFENFGRIRDKVETVGYVGSRYCLDLETHVITNALKDIGLNFKYLFCEDITVSRKDVVDFYKSIDIQLAFRKPSIKEHMPPELKNPLKIVNAGSFGIPTVAYPELNYAKSGLTYFSAMDMGDILEACRLLKESPGLYAATSQSVMSEAQPFHIREIAKLYKGLQ